MERTMVAKQVVGGGGREYVAQTMCRSASTLSVSPDGTIHLPSLRAG